MRARVTLSRACRPKLRKPEALHAARAIQRGAPRQDAFRILKLATYSSGFAGSNGFPITENDLYDAASGVRPISFVTAVRRGRFKLPTSRRDSARCRVVSGHLPDNLEAAVLHLPIGLNR